MTIRTRIAALLAVLALTASVAHADPGGGTGGGTIGSGGKPGLTGGMIASDPGGGTGGGTVTPKP